MLFAIPKPCTLLTLLMTVVSLTGCVETIVMDPHEEDLPVVVNCILTNSRMMDKISEYVDTHDYEAEWGTATYEGWTQYMTIKYVKGKSAPDFIPVTDARVYITYPLTYPPIQNLFDTLFFTHTGNGQWESVRPKFIKAGEEYSLSIEIPGRETIRAKTTGMESSIPIYMTFLEREAKATGYHWEYTPTDTILVHHEDPKVMEELEEEIMRRPYFFWWNAESALNNYDAYEKHKEDVVWIFAEEWTTDGWKDLDYLVTDYPYIDDFNVVGKQFSELTMLGRPDAADEWDARLGELFETSKRLHGGLSLHQSFLRIDRMEPYQPFFMGAGPIWYLNLDANDHYGKYKEDKHGKNMWHGSSFILYNIHCVNSDLDSYLRSVYVHNYNLSHSLLELYSTAPDIYSNIEGGMGIFACEQYRYLQALEPRFRYQINSFFDDDVNPFLTR